MSCNVMQSNVSMYVCMHVCMYVCMLVRYGMVCYESNVCMYVM